MKRFWTTALVLALCASGVRADDKEKAKEALRELSEFIGGWKGSGAPVKAKPAANEIWAETIEWGWKFKDGDAWIVLKVEKGKHIKEGEIRYNADKKGFTMTLTDPKGGKRVFDGQMKDNYLTFERTDADTKEIQRIVMNTAAEGVRFVYRYERKPQDRTLFLKDFQVSATKIGESLGKTEKKNECVVSGGVGTMSIVYKGETFYLCCSGCRDEFNANPDKYVREFKAKKK